MPESVGSSRHVVALVGGRYELVRELAGSAEVQRWEGFDVALDRYVVVELLRQDLLDQPSAVERFGRLTRSSKDAGERLPDGGTAPGTGRMFVVREHPRHATDRHNDPTLALEMPETAERAPHAGLLTRGRAALVGLAVLATV